jgi:hypothetical protein
VLINIFSAVDLFYMSWKIDLSPSGIKLIKAVSGQAAG